MAHACVPLALSCIEVGRWLEQRNIGLLVDDPEQVSQTISNLEPRDINALQQKVMEVSRSDVLADDTDCRKLVNRLAATIRL